MHEDSFILNPLGIPADSNRAGTALDHTSRCLKVKAGRRFRRQFEMLLAGGLQGRHLDQHLGRDFDLLL